MNLGAMLSQGRSKNTRHSYTGTLTLSKRQTESRWTFGILSILKAGNEPTFHEIPIDKAYQEELIQQAKFFMDSLKIGLEPVISVKAEAPVPVEDRVPYDMDFHKNSAKMEVLADIWKQTSGCCRNF